MKSTLLHLAGTLLFVALAATSCGGGQDSVDSQTPVALGIPKQRVEQPVRDARLVPGTRYLFPNVVPNVLDLELTAPSPALYNYSDASVAVLSTTDNFEVDALWFMDVDDLAVPADSFFSTESIAGPADLERLMRAAPKAILRYFARLPFVRTTQPLRPIAFAGFSGRAVDLRIGALPPRAAQCAFGTIHRCATITMMPGIGQTVQSGQHYRVILLKVRNNRILITQNLDLPATQTVLDTISFVPR